MDFYVDRKNAAGLRLLSERQFATAQHDSEALRKIPFYQVHFATTAFPVLMDAILIEKSTP
jgi:hypothetical protein